MGCFSTSTVHYKAEVEVLSGIGTGMEANEKYSAAPYSDSTNSVNSLHPAVPSNENIGTSNGTYQ